MLKYFPKSSEIYYYKIFFLCLEKYEYLNPLIKFTCHTVKSIKNYVRFRIVYSLYKIIFVTWTMKRNLTSEN